MRTTKLLIGSLAVLSFAACQNEELQTNDNATPSLGRGQIEVAVMMNEADTKMVNDNGDFSWEAGDELGACLVDPTEAGTVVDDAHLRNARFSWDNGIFTTAESMDKGTYVFYYPYVAENLSTRDGIIIKQLPAAQKWDANGDEMMKNNFMVSPVINMNEYEGSTLTLPMTMRSIYGYGEIELTNNSGLEVEIQKIVITNSTDKFDVGKTLAPATISADAYTDDNQKKHSLKVDLTGKDVDVAKALRSADSVYTQKPGLTASWIATKDAVKSDIVVSALDEEGNGITLKQGEKSTTRVLIPAGSYTASNVKVEVWTNLGYQKLSATSGNTFTVPAGVKKSIKLTLSKTWEDNTANTISVVDGEDLLASLKQFGSETVEVTVNPVGNLTLTGEVMAQIPENISLKFAEGSNVTFTGDMDLTRVTFTDKSTTASTVTLKDGNINVSEFTLGQGNNLVVDKNAVVTLDETVNGGGSSTITVKSEGTLNLENDIIAYLDVAGGTLNVGEEGAETEGVDPVELFIRDVTAGTVNINVPVEGQWDMEFGDGNLANKQADVQVNINADLTKTGSKTITVNADAKVANNANTDRISTNNGVIDQNGGDLVVGTNNGTINNKAAVAAGKLTIAGNNAATGIINTTAGSQTDLVGATNNGFVYYVAGAYVNGAGSGTQVEAGNVYFVVDKDTDITKIAADFAKSPCTALQVKDAKLTLPAIDEKTKNWSLDQLKSLQCVVLNKATVSVNAAVKLNHVGIHVYGTSALGEASNTGSITFTERDEDIIYVKEKANLTINVDITGLNKIDIAKDGSVLNNAKTVSGKADIIGDGKANWSGNNYVKAGN